MKGVKRHSARLKALANIDMQAALVRAAGLIAEDAKELVGTVGAGVPSRPGEPPHMQTGALQSGIVSGPMGENGAHVTSTDPASASLEFGRAHAMPRPYMRPAVQKNLKRIPKIVAAEVNIKLRRK